MMGLLAAIGFNLRNVHRFGGTEERGAFWPYAIFVIALAAIAMAALMIPEMLASIKRMEEFAAANPDLATVESGPGSYSISIEGHHPELMPDMASVMGGRGIIMGVVVLLLASAVARRLRDAGKSPLWGLMPLPFLAAANFLMPRVFGQSAPDLRIFFALFFNNLLYLAAVGFLIYLLAKPSLRRGDC